MIDRDSTIPLYMQLAELIRNQIRSGEIQVGDKLPSESEMIKKYLEDSKGKRIDPSNLNALSIIILLYYYGNAPMFDSDKKLLLEGINNKYNNVNLPDLRKDTELMVLTLDLSACPYISHNDRKYLCNKLQVDV